MGTDLHLLSENFGIHQLIREPMREKYLLDLYLTDITGMRIQVGPQIADHKFLLAHVPCPEITSLRVVRKRFNLRRAEWSNLKDSLKKIDWTVLKKGSADDAAKFCLEMLWFTLCNHIPYEEVSIHKRSHPWLNKKCEEAINAKNTAESTENYAEIRQK